jgi:hypothetical protein
VHDINSRIAAPTVCSGETSTMDGICVKVMADLATYFSVDCAATTL